MSLLDIYNKNAKVNTETIVGIDNGFGMIKVSSGNTDIKFPSVVGTPVSRFAKPAAISSLDELLHSLAITYNGNTYYIGHNAIMNTRNGKISLRQNKAEDEQNRIKTMTALALLTNEDETVRTFDIIAGLPVLEFYNQKDKLYNMFINGGLPFEFVMHYGNITVPKKILCRNVKIISQGEAAYYSYLLTDQGEIIDEHIEDVNGTILVVDVGYRTVDVVAMQNGRYMETISDQINNGVSQMHQEILRLIMEKYNIKKELKDIDEIVRDTSFFHNRHTYDLTRIIADAARPFAENLVESLYTITNDTLGNMQMILLTGGGAELIYSYVADMLHSTVKVIKLNNAEFSNSQGYFKYGKFLKNQGYFG